MPLLLNAIGTPFIELHTVDSTNNYAMALIPEGMAQHGTAVFTHEQTKGKGQRGKSWISQKDSNIAISIIIEPAALKLQQLFVFNMAIALGVQSFFNNYAGGDIKIKWPNDIYWRDRKAGGILIENVIQGTAWKYAIVGIGLNINQTDFGAFQYKAVSLKQITGKEFHTTSLAKELCTNIDIYFKQLLNNTSVIAEAYHTHLYKRGEVVHLKKGDKTFTTVITGVNEQGQLVTKQHGKEEIFDAGTVEWI